MRRFGKEKQEFFRFQLADDDKVYEIPLAASMPATLILKLKEEFDEGRGFESQLEMLRKYMGDVVDELTSSTAMDILNGWVKASSEQGAEVGES